MEIDMHHNLRRLLVSLLALAMALAACTQPEPTPAAGGAADEPSPVPSLAAPTPAEAIVEDPLGTATSLDDLRSYRIETTMASGWGDDEPERWTIVVESTTDPPARHAVTIHGLPEDEPDYETIEFDGSSYVRAGSDWIAMAGDPAVAEDTPGVWLLEPDLLQEQRCVLRGIEEVNGYEARHVACDIRALTGEAMDLGGLAGSVESGEAHVWLSTEHNVAVRSTLHYSIKGVDGAYGFVNLESVVTRINEPIEIERPVGVEISALHEGIPLMDDATELSPVLGMPTFGVPRPMAEVAEWYRVEMEERGWTYNADRSVEAMLDFSRDGRTATVLLGAMEDGGTSVTVMVVED